MKMLKDSEKKYIDFSAKILRDLSARKPLVHIISNIVTIESVADMVLATGASPIAAHAPEEVAEITQQANSLLLNTGTPDTPRFEAYLKAGNAAREKGIPVIFDPVGVGISEFRSRISRTIITNVKPTIIRMNHGEAAFIVRSEKNSLKGVDSVGDPVDESELINFAKENSVILVVTGAINRVTNGRETFETKLGNPLLRKITGGGCMLDAVIASFVTSTLGTIFDRTIAALVFYNYLSMKLKEGDVKRQLITLVREYKEEL